MPFKTILKNLVDKVPGATGAIMMDPDGEAVAEFATSTMTELPLIGAHKGIVINMIRDVETSKSGAKGVKNIGISTDSAKISISTMKDGYYLLLMIGKNKYLGKAFLESKKAITFLEKEMGYPEKPVEEGIMSISFEDVLRALNKDLELEYAATIQYIQHASVITGAKYESIQKELLIHSQEEIQHAVMISEQIDFLGGTPTVNVEKREVSKDSLEMLKQDLRGEEYAVRRYKERIAQAESLQEYGLRRILEDILIQEEEHKRDLLTVIED